MWFLANQMVNRINTATLVKVESVTTSGQVAGVGQLDVTPLVKMVDGAATAFDHGTVRKIHYSRMQGGSKAIILDPKPGDIGIAVFCDRDTSVVRKNKKASPPGSKRRFDVADGVYVMTVLGSQPTSYVQFEDDGSITLSPDNGTTIINAKVDGTVLVQAPTKVVVDCPDIRLGGDGATRKVALEASVTSDGATIISNLATKIKGI